MALQESKACLLVWVCLSFWLTVLIVGLLTRPAAAVIAFNMLVAVAMAHCGDVFSLSPMGGWAIELPMLFFFPAVALVFTGGGKYIIASRTCLD